MTKPDYSAILVEAHKAACDAIKAIAHEENTRGLDCGFAWVTIEGNSGLARYCRKAIKQAAQPNLLRRKLGDKAWPKGWQFWCPGEHAGQSVHIFEAGARAFRDVLARHGIVAFTSSRLD